MYEIYDCNKTKYPGKEYSTKLSQLHVSSKNFYILILPDYIEKEQRISIRKIEK